MSVAGSVALSGSAGSFHSASTDASAKLDSNPRLDTEDEDDGGDLDLYADASFGSDESNGVLVPLETSSNSASSETGAVEDHGEDYNDDEFELEEVEDLSSERNPHARDGNDNDNAQDEMYADDSFELEPGQVQCADRLNCDDETGSCHVDLLSPRRIERSQPPVNYDKPLDEWARTKLPASIQRSVNANAAVDPPRSAAGLDETAARSLLRRLQAIPPSRKRTSSSKLVRQRVPAALLERARVQHLLALSCHSPTVLSVGQLEAKTRRSLSTFFSVKAADLNGKLATTRLDELCARWQSPLEDGDGDVMSPGTCEFLATAIKHQRGIFRSQQNGEYVFQALRTHAMSMDRAVQQAKDAVADSRRLLRDAERVLKSKDARPCGCEFADNATRAS